MVKINSLSLANVKRVKAVELTPTDKGLTVIGGRNGQGKTSILDAIAWGLGGKKYQPSTPTRDGSYTPAKLEIRLSNGLVVTRSGQKGNLKVTDPTGAKAGQALLDSFIGELALNLPKFMAMSNTQKADQLLSLLGVQDKLLAIQQAYDEAYQNRREMGRLLKTQLGHVNQLPVYNDVPNEFVSVAELIQRQQEILARNGINQQKRQNLQALITKQEQLSREINDLTQKLQALQDEHDQVICDITVAQTTVAELKDECTTELEEQIKNIDDINNKVRSNQVYQMAKAEADKYQKAYDEWDSKVAKAKQDKFDLLASVKMPIVGLSIKDGALTYKDKEWDCMSGSEQLMVSTAIVKALNPDCGFVLMDKLEQLDTQTMQEFSKWLESQDLQVIATRVTDDKNDCTIIIEDGMVQQTEWSGFGC